MPTSESHAQVIQRLFPGFSSLSDQDAKKLLLALYFNVRVTEETKRVYKEMPSLTNRLKVVSFVKENGDSDALPNQGRADQTANYQVDFEINSETPKVLSIKVDIWERTDLEYQERIEISATYPYRAKDALRAKFRTACESCLNGGPGWIKYKSTGMPALFRSVAADLDRMASHDTSGTDVKQLMSALISKALADRGIEDYGDPDCRSVFSDADSEDTPTILDVMFGNLSRSIEH